MINPAKNELNEIPEILFYNKLDDEAPDNKNIDHYLNNCKECYPSDFTKNYIRQLVRNYENYKDHLRNEPYDKYCRFFIYWLYKSRKMQFSEYSPQLRNQWNKCIPCVWNQLEDNAYNHIKKCNFKNENTSFGVIQVQLALDEICSIKEKLKNDSKENSSIEKCSKINEIKKYYLKHILYHIGSIPSNSSWKKEYFEIDKNCSLKDIYDVLLEKQCNPKEIIKYLEPEECRTSALETKQDCTKESCRNIEELCQKQCTTQQSKNLDELGQERCTSQGPPNLEQLCPAYCSKNPISSVSTSEGQQENPAKNPYLQFPVTVFSSVVGTIFFFLFLYKFTPFRSWFLNRIGSKQTLKHKIKQDMEREFLGAPFQPPYRDDQSSRPPVGYSQN